MPGATNSLVEASAGLVHSSLKGLMGTDAYEAAIASVGGAAVSNQPIDLPEMLMESFVRHPLKTKYLYRAFLFAGYPALFRREYFS